MVKSIIYLPLVGITFLITLMILKSLFVKEALFTISSGTNSVSVGVTVIVSVYVSLILYSLLKR